MPRKSIYLPDEAITIIGTEEKGRFSSRLAGIITDYGLIVADAMPELTQNEWLFICSMLNGVQIEGRHTQFLGADIAESGEMDGLSEQFGVDGTVLGGKVDALPLASKIAIHNVAFKFWQNFGIVNDYAEVFKKCGAKIKLE